MWCILHHVNSQVEEMVALEVEQKEIFQFNKKLLKHNNRAWTISY